MRIPVNFSLQALTLDDAKSASLSVAPNTTLLRFSTESRTKYEIEFSLKRGTADNTYLLQSPSSGDTVLFDVPFEAYSTDFVSSVKGQTTLSAISHIILTQLDPKNIPSLILLLKAAAEERSSTSPPIQIVLSNPAARLLQSALGDTPEKADLLSSVQLTVARSGMKVPIGADDELELVLLPTPRWPDMMTAFSAKHKIMFTSKLFSAHVAPGAVNPTGADTGLDGGGWELYGEDWRHFFDCMIAPQARQALPALEKLELVPVPLQQPRKKKSGLGASIWNILTGRKTKGEEPQAAGSDVSGSQRPVSYLLPMHGPGISSAVTQLIGEYKKWTEDQVKAASTSCAVVLYASAYGNTAALAQAISRGVTKAGGAVDMLNLETQSLEDVSKAISSGSGFIIGSPTLGGHMPTQVQVALGAVIRDTEAKQMPCGVFGSFGWSGEAVDEMEQRLKDAGFKFAFTPIRVKFRPTAKDLQVCEESGRELALAIKRKLKTKEASVSAGDGKQMTASAPTLAMGRVLGSLSVVTAVNEDASSAMLASWISQASFNPPGITVSIKKDRAMEPLLVVGAKFAVSMVPEGGFDKVVMKKLARPFHPGEDRLAGLETMVGEVSGAPVLSKANAFMEVQVVSRMEAGDHWLVYGNVLAGKVLDEGSQTSVHHRKVGNHY